MTSSANSLMGNKTGPVSIIDDVNHGLGKHGGATQSSPTRLLIYDTMTNTTRTPPNGSRIEWFIRKICSIHLSFSVHQKDWCYAIKLGVSNTNKMM